MPKVICYFLSSSSFFNSSICSSLPISSTCSTINQVTRFKTYQFVTTIKKMKKLLPQNSNHFGQGTKTNSDFGSPSFWLPNPRVLKRVSTIWFSLLKTHFPQCIFKILSWHEICWNAQKFISRWAGCVDRDFDHEITVNLFKKALFFQQFKIVIFFKIENLNLYLNTSSLLFKVEL